ncbi:MAG TPA: hypothetical protein VFY16_06575 [Gemmatimonadaceae bacterium]|nr:hypothetical protein [Gemmatimonadaceae bacterium]
MRERAEVGPLWLATLQELGERVAHELRNALNGAAVNLEVVRSRVGVADAARVTPFVELAADQLAQVARLNDALLWAVRPAPAPADVAVAAERLVVLCAPIARAGGGGLELEPIDHPGLTSAPPELVRLLLTRLLLDAAGARAPARCIVGGGGGGGEGGAARVEVLCPGGPPLALAEPLRLVAEAGGVGVECASDRCLLVFPARGGESGGISYQA